MHPDEPVQTVPSCSPSGTAVSAQASGAPAGASLGVRMRLGGYFFPSCDSVIPVKGHHAGHPPLEGQATVPRDQKTVSMAGATPVSTTLSQGSSYGDTQ